MEIEHKFYVYEKQYKLNLIHKQSGVKMLRLKPCDLFFTIFFLFQTIISITNQNKYIFPQSNMLTYKNDL